MKLLAFDTATDACSVALRVDGDTCCDHRLAPQAHADLLIPMIDALLAEAGLRPAMLDGLVFGEGPGSFTGLRIAAATAQGIAFAAGLGVLGISTLAAIAAGCRRAFDDRDVEVAIDARMGGVYRGRYRLGDEIGRIDTLEPQALLKPEALPDTSRALDGRSIAGSGVDRYRDAWPLDGEGAPVHRPDRWPEAVDLLDIAAARLPSIGWREPEAAVPVYLRERVALTEAERQAGMRLV